MNDILIKFFLNINEYFPKKTHPFNNSQNGVLDLNYTDFEYNHTPDLLKMYSKFINLEELKNKKILDLGCGGGGKAIFIAEKYNSQVTGIDLNLNFLNQANNKIKELNIEKKILFKEQDALNMDFKNEEFDIIIMSDVIEHIPYTAKLFKEINRVLKKGGIIMFDFAPYYHYFGHHIWDTIRIPWLHLITTESFRIKLYKESVKKLPDADKRINLRIGLNTINKESFTYLNGISRGDFERIVNEEYVNYKSVNIKYFMLKNMTFLSKIPILREVFIKHIIGTFKK